LGGHISGGHYNPAVTLAVAITRRGKISVLTAFIYICVQLLAAFVAALMSWAILDNTFHPSPGPGHSDVRATVAEAVWTFLLATVVLQCATTATQAGNSFFGLAIGFTVLAGAIGVGPISGGVFNPAVGTGPTIVDAINRGSDALDDLWIYWVGPLLGGMIAGAVFWFTNYSTEFLPVYDAEHQKEATSLFSPEAVPSLADKSAEVSKVTRKFEKRLEHKIRHPLDHGEEEVGVKDAINSSESESLLSDGDKEPQQEERELSDRKKIKSLYGANLPSLADAGSAEASKATKEFAKRLV